MNKLNLGVKNMLIFGIFIGLIFGAGITALAQRKESKSDLITRVERCVYDLIQSKAELVTFISETDSDVNLFVSGRNLTSLTVEDFQAGYRISQQTVVEQREVDYFYNRVSGRDDEPQWNDLLQYIESQATNVTVFKVGTIQHQYFFVGLINGKIVGIVAYGLDT